MTRRQQPTVILNEVKDLAWAWQEARGDRPKPHAGEAQAAGEFLARSFTLFRACPEPARRDDIPQDLVGWDVDLFPLKDEEPQLTPSCVATS